MIKKVIYDLFTPQLLTQPLKKSIAPILILHCTLGNRKEWTDIAQKIANKTLHKVYTIDARNHGENSRRRTLNFCDMADDLEVFLDGNNIKECHIFGHSMGGRTGMVLALTKANYLKSLSAIDVSPTRPPTALLNSILNYAKLLRNALNMLDLNMTEEKARQFCEKILEKENLHWSITKLLSSNIVKKEGLFALRTNLDYLEERFEIDLLPFPSFSTTFNGPVQFIGGGHSNFIRPEDHPAIYKLFPKAQIITMENVNHLIHLEQPELLTEKYLEFFRENFETSKP